MATYIELHARSAFSFLRGAATPEELIATGAELKMPAMALLDNDGVYGSARFHLAAQKLGIKAHIGAEIAVSSFRFQGSSPKSKTPGHSRFQNPVTIIQHPRSSLCRCAREDVHALVNRWEKAIFTDLVCQTSPFEYASQRQIRMGNFQGDSLLA